MNELNITKLNPSRRDFLYGLSASLGSVALTEMLQAQTPSSPLAPKQPMHEPKAKACIMFFMDVFDKNFRDFVSKNGERDNGEKIWYEFGDGYIRCPDCIAKDVGLGSWDLNEDIFL